MQTINPDKVHSTIAKGMLADGMEIVYDLEKSHGSWLHDSVTGKEYLDFFSFFASMPISHNHPKMIDPAFKQKLADVAVVKPSNSDIYTVEMAEFVDNFNRFAARPYFDYLFFVSGGALAVENALKTAFDWKVRKNGQAGEPDVTDLKILHFKEAFHGRSGYTMSLTNTSDPRKYRFFAKFDWPRVSNPKLTFPTTEENLKQVMQMEKQTIEEIQRTLEEHKNKIAAIIIEPIQGEGGDNHFRGEFLRELRRIATEHDLLYILDEIQTGMGLTGKLWAFEHFDVVPDIITFGKKAQVCGIAATKRLDEVEDHVFAESSRINSTFGGNLVDMVRCTQYLKIIEEEKLIENAKQVGEKILTALIERQTDYPTLISNCRGRGLMIAFDLPSEKLRDQFLTSLYEKRLLALPCGDRSIRFRPHLDIQESEARKSLTMLDAAIKEVNV